MKWYIIFLFTLHSSVFSFCGSTWHDALEWLCHTYHTEKSCPHGWPQCALQHCSSSDRSNHTGHIWEAPHLARIYWLPKTRPVAPGKTMPLEHGELLNTRTKLVANILFPRLNQGIRGGAWLGHIVFAFLVYVVSFSHVVVECSDVGQGHIADWAKALSGLTVERANVPSRILPVGKCFLALNANYPRTLIF